MNGCRETLESDAWPRAQEQAWTEKEAGKATKLCEKARFEAFRVVTSKYVESTSKIQFDLLEMV